MAACLYDILWCSLISGIAREGQQKIYKVGKVATSVTSLISNCLSGNISATKGATTGNIIVIGKDIKRDHSHSPSRRGFGGEGDLSRLRSGRKEYGEAKVAWRPSAGRGRVNGSERNQLAFYG